MESALAAARDFTVYLKGLFRCTPPTELSHLREAASYQSASYAFVDEYFANSPGYIEHVFRVHNHSGVANDFGQ
jgi:hypothetical protein